jgi:hypothetical protein
MRGMTVIGAQSPLMQHSILPLTGTCLTCHCFEALSFLFFCHCRSMTVQKCGKLPIPMCKRTSYSGN